MRVMPSSYAVWKELWCLGKIKHFQQLSKYIFTHSLWCTQRHACDNSWASTSFISYALNTVFSVTETLQVDRRQLIRGRNADFKGICNLLLPQPLEANDKILMWGVWNRPVWGEDRELEFTEAFSSCLFSQVNKKDISLGENSPGQFQH